MAMSSSNEDLGLSVCRDNYSHYLKVIIFSRESPDLCCLSGPQEAEDSGSSSFKAGGDFRD